MKKFAITMYIFTTALVGYSEDDRHNLKVNGDSFQTEYLVSASRNQDSVTLNIQLVDGTYQYNWMSVFMPAKIELLMNNERNRMVVSHSNPDLKRVFEKSDQITREISFSLSAFIVSTLYNDIDVIKMLADNQLDGALGQRVS
jgi:hypothetical protein